MSATWPKTILRNSNVLGNNGVEAEQKTSPHFLGAVVLKQVPTAAKEIDQREVIDGQQRVTTLQPNDVTALFVKRIFDMAENGTGMLDIARAINDEDIPSATGKLWSSSGV